MTVFQLISEIGCSDLLRVQRTRSSIYAVKIGNNYYHKLKTYQDLETMYLDLSDGMIRIDNHKISSI